MRKAAVALILALGACRRDGGAPEGAAKLNAPPPVHLVARVRDGARLHVLEDGTALLDAGLFVYELRASGPPIPLGDVAAYAALLPERPFAPNEYARTPRLVVTGTRSRLALDDRLGMDSDQWDGTKWTHVKRPPTPTITADTPVGVTIPKRYRGLEWKRLANETWLGVGEDVEERGETAVLVKPPSPDLEPAPFEGNTHDCGIVPSADGRGWVLCQSPQTSLFRLEGRKWTLVPAQHVRRFGRPSRMYQEGSIAVGPDGTVWYDDADDRLRVRRYLPSGHHDDLELPHVTTAWPAALDADGVRPAEERKSSQIGQLVPLRSGVMWAVVRGEDNQSLVYRIGGSAPPASTYVGSILDQRAQVANAVGPVPATGHCTPVFVPLVVARGASFPTERLATRRAIVDEARGRGGSVVIGWHGDRRAAGVLFLREDEDLIAKLVDAFSDDPTSPPRPSCTPPVVERRIDP